MSLDRDREIREIELASLNTAPRLPIIFLVDNSFSMIKKYKDNKKRIEMVNEELRNFVEDFANNPYACDGLEITLILFGDTAQTVYKFEPVQNIDAKSIDIKAEGGNTCLGEALELAIKLLDERLQFYKDTSLHYYKPNIVIMTDGEATDIAKLEKMSGVIQQRQNTKQALKIFSLAIGDEGAEKTLSAYHLQDEELKGLDIVSFSQYLSRSMTSQSKTHYDGE